MPNKNYQKGIRKEYKIIHTLERVGFDIVQRTAGSHSPIDVIAIDKKNKIIRFIQSKPDSMPESQKNKLLAEQTDLNGTFTVVFEVI